MEKSVRMVANEMIQLDERRHLTLREAIVVEFPPIFAEQRIGGLLSPQLLAPRHAASASTIAVTIGGSAPSCGPDGLIGMDALRQCVLVLGESAFAWSCQAE